MRCGAGGIDEILRRQAGQFWCAPSSRTAGRGIAQHSAEVPSLADATAPLILTVKPCYKQLSGFRSGVSRCTCLRFHFWYGIRSRLK
jgi:hypothetical protein